MVIIDLDSHGVPLAAYTADKLWAEKSEEILESVSGEIPRDGWLVR